MDQSKGEQPALPQTCHLCDACDDDVQWAYVGDKAGSYLDLKLDTRTSTSRDGAPHAPIVLTHWRGPSGMGQAGALRGNTIYLWRWTESRARRRDLLVPQKLQTSHGACGTNLS